MVHADGILVYERACLVRGSAGVTLQRSRSAPDPLDSVCRLLTGCNTRAAAALCALEPRAARAAHAIEEFSSFRVADSPQGAGEVNASYRRLAVITVTGNPGHDAFFEGGLLDFFAEQEMHGGPGYFDAIVLEVRQLMDAPFEQALRWTLAMLEVLFAPAASATQVLVTVRGDSKRSRTALPFAHLPTARLCAGEVHVRARMGLTGLSWGNLRWLPVWRDRVLKSAQPPPPLPPSNETALVGSDAGASRLVPMPLRQPARLRPSGRLSKNPRVVLYSRADTSRRRLLIPEEGGAGWLRRALGVNVALVTKQGADALEQARLYAGADVVISPHGAHAVNAALMHQNALYIEIAPFCVQMCSEGCAADLRDGAGAFDVPLEQACALLLSMYAPLQLYSGVRYHVLTACVGGNRCVRGKTKPMWSVHRADRSTSIKYNWQSDVHLDHALADHIRAVINGSDTSSRVAPFSLDCARRPPPNASRPEEPPARPTPARPPWGTLQAASRGPELKASPSTNQKPTKTAAGGTKQPACTWQNGCCRRHPRISSCLESYANVVHQNQPVAHP